MDDQEIDPEMVQALCRQLGEALEQNYRIEASFRAGMSLPRYFFVRNHQPRSAQAPAISGDLLDRGRDQAVVTRYNLWHSSHAVAVPDQDQAHVIEDQRTAWHQSPDPIEPVVWRGTMRPGMRPRARQGGRLCKETAAKIKEEVAREYYYAYLVGRKMRLGEINTFLEQAGFSPVSGEGLLPCLTIDEEMKP